MTRCAVSNLKSIRLIIGTVGTRYDFFECVRSRQPCFKIVLSRCYCTHVTRADVDHFVMQAECIPQINTILQQFFVQFPRSFRRCDDDLFDLGELMDAPNTTIGLTMGANLSAEARRNANNLQWKELLRNSFLHVHRSQRMLRCSNHVVTIRVDTIHHRLKV